MDVLTIPFNKYLGLERCEKEGYILKLPNKNEYLNHIETIHASVQFALAEATSGEFLLQEFKDFEFDVIPVVRKSEVKYSCPAEGTLCSKAEFIELNKNEIEHKLEFSNRIIVKIQVSVLNESEDIVMTAIFEWFIAKD